MYAWQGVFVPLGRFHHTLGSIREETSHSGSVLVANFGTGKVRTWLNQSHGTLGTEKRRSELPRSSLARSWTHPSIMTPASGDYTSCHPLRHTRNSIPQYHTRLPSSTADLHLSPKPRYISSTAHFPDLSGLLFPLFPFSPSPSIHLVPPLDPRLTIPPAKTTAAPPPPRAAS